MIARRLCVALAVVSLFLTSSAGCFAAGVTPAQMRACCRMGHCAPQKTSPCSQVSPQTTPKALHDREKVSLVRPAPVVTPLAVAVNTPASYLPGASRAWFAAAGSLTGQPPGAAALVCPLRI